jgi:phage terminase large subunit-like protein
VSATAEREHSAYWSGDAWAAYAEGTRAAHFAWWCEAYCIQSVDVFAGQPLVLEEWEREIMGEALAVDALDAPCWRTVVIELPRKNGKTSLLAGYALYCLLHDEGAPEILLAAASDKQAGRLFDAAVSFLRRNPALSAQVHIREYVGEIARVDGGGKVIRMSSDPKALHGYNPHKVVADELAQWTTPTLRGAWGALTTAGGARRQFQVFAITTAGEAVTRDDGILGTVIDRAAAMGETETQGARDIVRSAESRTLVVTYTAPMPEADPAPLRAAHAVLRRAEREGRDTAEEQHAYHRAAERVAKAWKAANPASWITEEFLLRQALAPELTVAEVLQLHAGVWAAGEHTWITREAWQEAARPDAALETGDPIALGFDGSRFQDATALVACRIADGLLVPLAVWEAPVTVGQSSWEVPRDEVEAAVAAAFHDHPVARFYADPPYWQTEIDAWAQTWGDRTVVPWHTARERQMAGALERLETDFIAGLVTHDGSDVLRRHVVNAVRFPTRSGYGLRKPAKLSDRKIDAAVAAVLAYEARCDAVAAGWRLRSRVPVSL